MARSLGPRWNGYIDGVAVRSGTSDIFNKKKAAGIQVDSGASYQLKFNQNGVVQTVADLSSVQTFTNKTITAGVYAGGIDQDYAALAATATFTTNTILANLTGLSAVLVAGKTYMYEVSLLTTQTTNGGLQVAFKQTNSLTLTSIAALSEQVSASAIAVAQYTSTVDANPIVNNKTAVYLATRIRGTLVVGVGGTVTVQAAQNTSNSDTTSVLLGSWAQFTRLN